MTDELTKTEPEDTNGRAPMSLRQAALMMLPRTMDEGMRLAVALSKSRLIPKGMENPADIFLAVQWGAEIGLGPMQAVQSICVINGRPALWGDAVPGLIYASGLLEQFDEYFEHEEDSTLITAVCVMKRKGMNARTKTFSMRDAQEAGLAGKPGPWQQYRKRMLQLRARGFNARDVFPDVLRGVVTVEEARDMPDLEVAIEGKVIAPSPLETYMGFLPDEDKVKLRAIVDDSGVTPGELAVLLKKFRDDANGLATALFDYKVAHKAAAEAGPEPQAAAQVGPPPKKAPKKDKPAPPPPPPPAPPAPVAEPEAKPAPEPEPEPEPQAADSAEAAGLLDF